jgi:hypothetical protein
MTNFMGIRLKYAKPVRQLMESIHLFERRPESPFKHYDLREMEQYATLEVREGVVIPTTDEGAWEHLPKFRWVYSKLDVALSQGMDAAPMGVVPKNFPVFMKPVINLHGAGVGARALATEDEYEKHKHLSGFFWMEHLQGDHLSHDFVVDKGEVLFTLTFRGESLGKGMFDYWETVDGGNSVLYAKEWIRKYLADYTGCVNLEMLGYRIIECHLRMGDIDGLGDAELMQGIVDVYAGKRWTFSKKLKPFYEFALWGEWGTTYAIDEDKAKDICTNLTFCQIDDSRLYFQNPVGGVRVAIIGGYDKLECVRARQLLYESFSPKPREPRTVY